MAQSGGPFVQLSNLIAKRHQENNPFFIKITNNRMIINNKKGYISQYDF